ncbi:MAG TPA: hypothetical protein VE439_07020 [Anaerolineae bacterium]|nr:hypothetical protein [Anaerolineae bacterium]
MAGVVEAKAELERESVALSPVEATPERLIELTKDIFSKGYGDVELIGKVDDSQICYVELIDTNGATSFVELADDTKLTLVNSNYAIEDGVLCESITVQSSNPQALEVLDRWTRVEADYFNLIDEETTPPLQQLDALVAAARKIASSLGEPEKLQFILRPTELHDNLLRALMEARGVRLERVEQDS